MASQLSNFRSLANDSCLTALVPVWDAGEEIAVLAKTGHFVLGSSRQCDVRVILPGVAPQHCRIECSEEGTFVTPVDHHEVRINDLLLTESQHIATGDVLSLGPAAFKVESRRESRTRRPISGRRRNPPATAEAVIPQQAAPVAVPLPAVSPLMTELLSDAGDTRRRLLDSREAQLTELQIRLEQRSMELDARSEQLTRQQTHLLTRQSDLQRHRNEIEARYREEFEKINDQKISLLQTSATEVTEQQEALRSLTEQFEEQKERLHEREMQLNDTSEQLAAGRREIEELRQQYQSAQEDLRTKLSDLDRQHTRERAEWMQQVEQLTVSAEEFAEQQKVLEAAKRDFEHAKRDHLGRIEDARADIERREAELTWQLESLEEQSGKAILAKDDIAAQKQQLDEARADVERRETVLNERLKSLEEQSGAVLQAQKDIAEQKQELVAARDQLQTDRDQQTAEIQSARADIERREAELGTQLESLEQRSDSVARAQEDIATQQQELEAARGDIERREAELQEQLTSLEEQTNSVSLAQEEIAAQQQELEAARADIARRETQLKDQLTSLDEQTNSVARAQEEVAARQQELEAARVRLDRDKALRVAEFDQKRVHLKAQSASMEEQARQLAKDTEILEQSRRNHESTVVEWHQKTVGAETAVARERASLEELQQQLQSEAEELTRQRQQLEEQSHGQAKQLAELDARAAEISAWELELDERHEETASRVLQVKQLLSAQVKANADSGTEHTTPDAELAAERERCAGLTAERDELSTALTELRQAFESVRDELVQRNAEAEQRMDNTELHDARTCLETREKELDQLRGELQNQKAESERLLSELKERSEQFESECQQLKSQLDEIRLSTEPSGDGDGEEKLLQEIQDLRAELSASQQEHAGSDEFRQQLQQYEEQIRDLTAQLKDAQENTGPADASGKEEQYLQVIAELKQTLEEQQVRMQGLEAADTEGTAASADEARLLHRELDDRTIVLDQREEEIRERHRMVENKENELEQQRRELLESRQQLELARAEIQIAMDTSASAVTEPEQDPAPAELPEAVDENVEEDRPEVRSELAELFGLTNSASETPDPPPAESELPAVDDYSQETAAAVSMSFNQTGSVLLPPTGDADTGDAALEEAHEAEQSGDDDDLVANYMEQLLARNREKAGGSLPEELQQEKKSPKEEAKPAGQTSFIEAYMSGQYGEPDAAVSETADRGEPDVDMGQQPVSKPTVSRPKIDLNALRSDMDSFRQLSTKSVENALATHAKRQERGGLAARSTVCIVLAVVCVCMVAAAMMQIIPFGMVVWMSVAAAVVSAGELAYKTWSVSQRVKKSTQNLAPVEPARPLQKPEMVSENENENDNVSGTTEALPAPSDSGRVANADELSVSEPPEPMEAVMEAAAQKLMAEADESAVPQMTGGDPSVDAMVEQMMSVPDVPGPPDATDHASPEASRAPSASADPPVNSSAGSMGRSQIEELLAEITGTGTTEESGSEEAP